MKTLVAIAVLLLTPRAHAQDGGTRIVELSPVEKLLPHYVNVDHGDLTQPDGGTIHVVGGGWLREDTLIYSARDERGDHIEKKQLEQKTLADPDLYKILIGVLLIGAAGGFFLDEYRRGFK